MTFRINRAPNDGLWHVHDDMRPVTAGGRRVEPLTSYQAAVKALARAWSDAGAPVVVGDAEVPLQPFTIPIAWVEGEPTGDGRTIALDACKTRNLPIPFLVLDHTNDWGHVGAVVAGRIDTCNTIPDPEVNGQQVGTMTGVYSGDQYGARGYELAKNGFARGVSIDMTAAETEMVWPDPPIGLDEDELWLWEMMCWPDEVFTYAEIGAVTQCPIPAFARAYVQVDGAEFPTPGRPAPLPADTESAEVDGALAASAREQIVLSFTRAREDGVFYHMAPLPEKLQALSASATAPAATDVHPTPVRPPRAWFQNPSLPGPMPLTITDDGHVFGHAATWDVEHVGLRNGRTAPHSVTNYSRFRLGNVLTEEGELVATGPLTIGGGHADIHLTEDAARRHYDDTTTAWADVSCGEDEWGIWVNGRVRLNVTEATVQEARGSSLSGDWRPCDTNGDGIDDNLEAVAFLCVNTPGFPRPQALMASGKLVALTAAGTSTLVALRKQMTVDASTQAAIDAAVAPLTASLARMERAARPSVVALMRERLTRG